MIGKIDQLAFYCPTEAHEEFVRKLFGLDGPPDVIDHVTSDAKVGPYRGSNTAVLQFWYSHGIEFEILRYVDGPHWHTNKSIPFGTLSHYGIHLDDAQEMPDLAVSHGLLLVQENFTKEHTSTYLTDPHSPGFGRKYHYRIYQMPDGNYLKLIKRIHRSVNG